MAQKPAVVHYFAGRGRAEQARWMLAATGTPFVDRVLTTHAEFIEMRDGGALLFGQLPLVVLELWRPLAQTGQNADPLMVLPRPGEHFVHEGRSVASVKKPVGHAAQPLVSPRT